MFVPTHNHFTKRGNTSGVLYTGVGILPGP